MQLFTIYLFLILNYLSSVLSIKVSSCARWSKTGITIVGNGKPGNFSNQLNTPRGIFIRKSANELYVADTENNRIQMFSLNRSSMMGITVASTDGSPRKLFIDEDNGPVIYVTLWNSNRAEKWIPGALSGVPVGHQCRFCDGIVIDKKKNVYMAESLDNLVIQWSPETTFTTTLITGVGDNKSLDEGVFSPRGIYIDKNDDSLYVADCMHHQILKWPQGAKKGIPVARSYTHQGVEDTGLLDCPNAVLVDEETGMIYITEAVKQRVQRWFINATEGEVIIGGSDPNGFMGTPTDLAFDVMGNLYVSDSKYHRVQMFALIDNRPCNETSTEGAAAIKNHFHWITTIVIHLLSVILLK